MNSQARMMTAFSDSASDDTDTEYFDISGFAFCFESGKPIRHARLTAQEDPTYDCGTTNEEGHFHFRWPKSKPEISLKIDSPGRFFPFFTGYRSTQTATITIPPEGIRDPNYFKNISLQVVSRAAFMGIKLAIGKREIPGRCHIATTVTLPGIDMSDIPQGLAGVTARLEPDPGVRPFYFGVNERTGRTDVFERTLESTSHDGGILFANVPLGRYTLIAEKVMPDGHVRAFTRIQFNAFEPGVVYNASPPFCPHLILPTEEEPLREEERLAFALT